MAYLGHAYTAAMKERERRARYIELAVEILWEEPRPETAALREWAAGIVDLYTELPLSDAAQRDLVTRGALRREAVLAFDQVMQEAEEGQLRQMQETAPRMNFDAIDKTPGGAGITVPAVKAELAKLGLYDGPMDTSLAPAFFDAVEGFQSRTHLVPADGIFGPDTLKALHGRGQG